LEGLYQLGARDLTIVSIVASRPTLWVLLGQFPGLNVICAAVDGFSKGRIVPGIGIFRERYKLNRNFSNSKISTDEVRTEQRQVARELVTKSEVQHTKQVDNCCISGQDFDGEGRLLGYRLSQVSKPDNFLETKQDTDFCDLFQEQTTIKILEQNRIERKIKKFQSEYGSDNTRTK